MKSFISTIVFTAVSTLLMSFLPGDDCTMYAPVKPGMETELKHYTDNDKLTGSSKMKVLNVTDNGRRIEMLSESFDKKEKPVGSGTVVLACENGAFTVDMRNMIPSEQTSAYKDMKMNVEGDRLDIPADPQAGQMLKNGSVKLTATSDGSPITFKITLNVTNRQVAAVEEVTVPAGKFNCVKITYDAEMKNLFTIRTKVTEWYAKEVGLVRSETHNSKGKLQGYSVLASVK